MQLEPGRSEACPPLASVRVVHAASRVVPTETNVCLQPTETQGD